jgi:hypothetical protein
MGADGTLLMMLCMALPFEPLPSTTTVREFPQKRTRLCVSECVRESECKEISLTANATTRTDSETLVAI